MSSISLDSLTSQYQQYLNSTSTSNVENTLSGDLSNASDDELLDACKEFESYFIEQIYKEAEKTIMKADDDSDSASSSMTDYYQEQLYQQYAEMTMDQGGFGLAQKLYEQMKRNYQD